MPSNQPGNNNLPGGNTKDAQAKKAQIGSTWTDSGNINIDLDNLLGKQNKGAAPSMNQLKSVNNSPVHQQRPPVMSPVSPTGGFNMGGAPMGQPKPFASFNQSQGAFIMHENNNNFNQFNAFQ
jgi:hypothetical protein